MWKNNSPVMIVSKTKKNVFLMLTAHTEPDLWEALHKKNIVYEFDNIQRYGVDILNQMFFHYTWHTICESWALVVLTFILDFAAVNAGTILKDRKANYGSTRKVFLGNLVISLVIPDM